MTTNNAPPDALFGKIAVMLGFVTTNIISECLRISEVTGQKLGDVLVDRKYMQSDDRDMVLTIQKVRIQQKENQLLAKIAVTNAFVDEKTMSNALKDVQKEQVRSPLTPIRLDDHLLLFQIMNKNQLAAVKAVRDRLYAQSSKEAVLLGKIAIEENLASKTTIMKAAEIKALHPEKQFEEILEEEGLMSKEDIAKAKKIQQKRLTQENPLRKGQTRKDTLLGTIAVESGMMSAAQLDQALSIQTSKSVGKKEVALGEVLVSGGFLTREQLDSLLAEQDVASGRSDPAFEDNADTQLLCAILGEEAKNTTRKKKSQAGSVMGSGMWELDESKLNVRSSQQEEEARFAKIESAGEEERKKAQQKQLILIGVLFGAVVLIIIFMYVL
ncbi:MAG: hypothetical protein NUW37_08995 [Planctomycetes bacterium]|nr:hypothetical protein [Planctomycetota bacterium]